MGGALAQLLDLRKLAYFVAVAEDLHFGHAAQRVHVSQPVLSRAVSSLERELDTQLLQRDTRHVALTAAGRQLLEDGRPLLASAEATRRRTHDLAMGAERLTVGFMVGDAVAPAASAFRARRPEVEVALLRVSWHDQVDVLRDGRADLCFLHLPIAQEGLTLMPVREEACVALLPGEHALAAQESVTIKDLSDDPVICQGGADPEWQAFHDVDPRSDGRHPREGPTVWNIEEKFEHVAAGRGIGLAPASAAAVYSRRGVVWRPVADIPPLQICLGWLEARSSDVITDFAATVRGVEPRS
jgi:DNA-binding transcriptional LysR family regulator